MSLQYVASADGTRIGFDVSGAGPALVLLHGATADRSRWDGIAPALAARYTLYRIDRRGRGASAGDTAPYSVLREAEDLLAVCASAAAAQGGTPVDVLAHSYGGFVALLAALPERAANIARLMVYEPAFAPPGFAVPTAIIDAVDACIAAGRLDDALSLFYVELIGVPKAGVEQMRQTPAWAARLAATPPLSREAAAVNHGPPPGLAGIRLPVRVLAGTTSPGWLLAAARTTAQLVPGADLVELPGQAHSAMDTAPALFLAEVERYFGAPR